MSPPPISTALGLTRSRAATLHALARAVLERRIDFSAAPEEVVAALAALPGIGAWTAQYVALRALGEPDALPSGDLVLRRMAAPLKQMLSGSELEERAQEWQPWRGYAVMHLWRAAGPARRPRGLARVQLMQRNASGDGHVLVRNGLARRHIAAGRKSRGALTRVHFQAGAGALRASAAWRPAAAPFAHGIAQLPEYFAGKRRVFSLPLAPRGTPFQRSVWQALRQIPYGETVSYGELARRLGHARAARAPWDWRTVPTRCRSSFPVIASSAPTAR